MDWSTNITWKQKSTEKKKIYQRFLETVRPAGLIKKLPALHDEVFSKIDCLDCANCCKNHSPTFKSTDLKRISKYLRIKETDFIAQYLRLDEDNDFVLQKSPCNFLNTDNSCRIYDVRPSDCSRYPYTNEDVFIKRKKLTMANSIVCPAVYHILEKLTAM